MLKDDVSPTLGPKCGDVYRGAAENLVIYFGSRKESLFSPSENLIWSPSKGTRWVGSHWFDREHEKAYFRDSGKKVFIDLKLERIELTQKQFDQMGKRPFEKLEQYLEWEEVRSELENIITSLERKIGKLRFG